jgi:hypothetical protein
MIRFSRGLGRAASLAVLLMGGASLLAPAFATASAQRDARPAIRDIGPILARATDSITVVTQFVAFPNGRVAINDARRRHVIILDSSLTHEIVVMDTSTGARRSYGRGGQIIPYRGDSLLFADPGSLAMLVIDAAGNIGNTVAFPPGRVPANAGQRRIDPRGRLVYQEMQAAGSGPGRAGGRGAGACVDSDAQDSTAILRADLATRTVDQIGFLRRDKFPCSAQVPPVDGATMKQTPVDPVFLRSDVWGMLADGTVAIVRANYSINWIDPDGGLRSSPPVPADWHHLSDSEKVLIVDSLSAYNNNHPTGMVMMPNGTSQPFSNLVQAPSHVPDYPPVFAGAPIGDRDGNLWIREGTLHLPYQPLNTDPPVYDVVDRAGVLVDRVRIPGGTTLVGFGPGVAYLTSREGTGVSLVRVRIH